MDPLTAARVTGTVIQQRKTIGKVFLILLGGIVAVIFFFIFGSSGTEEQDGSSQNLPPSVLRWEKQATSIAKKNGIEKYTYLILAIIAVESRGEGLDIMQSAESAGLGQNGFSDPVASMEQGIKYFAENIKKTEGLEVDFWAAVQGYNFGSGYIDYVAKNGKKHSTNVAENFSKSVLAPMLGNTFGSKYPYSNEVSSADGRTYLYSNGGNFHYVGLVKQYVNTDSKGGGGGSKVPGGKYGYPFELMQPITSPYSTRLDPFTGQVDNHTGQDFGAPFGTPILASKDGKVLQASDIGDSYGICVVIEHSDGWKTRYGHMSQTKTSVGAKVKKGQVIGLIGSTGRSSGPHLHFEIFSGKTHLYEGHVDPAPYLGLK